MSLIEKLLNNDSSSDDSTSDSSVEVDLFMTTKKKFEIRKLLIIGIVGFASELEYEMRDYGYGHYYCIIIMYCMYCIICIYIVLLYYNYTKYISILYFTWVCFLYCVLCVLVLCGIYEKGTRRGIGRSFYSGELNWMT